MMPGDSKKNVTKMARGKAHFRDQRMKGRGGQMGTVSIETLLENLGSEKVKEFVVEKSFEMKRR